MGNTWGHPQNLISLVSGGVQVHIYISKTSLRFRVIYPNASWRFPPPVPQTPTIHTRHFNLMFLLLRLPLLYIPSQGNHHHTIQPPNPQATQAENFGDILGFSLFLIPLPPESVSTKSHAFSLNISQISPSSLYTLLIAWFMFIIPCIFEKFFYSVYIFEMILH